jgi:hypothetical protein
MPKTAGARLRPQHSGVSSAEALESMSGLFVKFGGHMHAAGVTLEACARGGVPRALQRLRRAMPAPGRFSPVLDVDAVLELREIDDRSVEGVFALAPFGHGHEPPLLRGAERGSGRPAPAIMKEKHLRVPLRGKTAAPYAQGLELRGARRRVRTRSARRRAFRELEEDAFSASRGYPGWAARVRSAKRQPPGPLVCNSGLTLDLDARAVSRLALDPHRIRCRTAPFSRSFTLLTPMPCSSSVASLDSGMPTPSSSTTGAAAIRRPVRIRMVPPSTLLLNPCLMEFSTSGCSSMLGTSMSSVSAATSFSKRSLSPKRTTSMAR